MTTIAWDGYTLAADKQSSASYLKTTVTKIFRVPQGIIGFSGNFSKAMELLNWFVNLDCRPELYPCFQNNEEGYVTCMLITNNGCIQKYESTAFPFTIECKFHAIGSGRDFALSAMYCGQTAQNAILTATVFDPSTGMGVDTLSFDDPLPILEQL